MATEFKNVIMFSMRRAGSTAFWQCFRKSGHYLCIDEPFNPKLRELPQEHRKGTRAEIIEMYDRSPSEFLRKFSPIERQQELEPNLTPDQFAYMDWLLLQADRPKFIGVTRCNCKMEAMIDKYRDCVFIYLFRHASKVAESHLVPSDGLNFGGIRRLYKRSVMFSRIAHYNSWGYEDLLCQQNYSQFAPLFQAYDIVITKNDKPYVRLLKYWLLNYRLALAAQKAATQLDTPFHLVDFEAFCQLQHAYLKGLEPSWLPVPEMYLDTSSIRQSSNHNISIPAWKDAAVAAGFTDDELLLV